MALKDLLGKKEKSIEDRDLLELSEEVEGGEVRAVPIEVIELEEYQDAEDVQKSVREGRIVFVKIKRLKEKDMSDLKRAIERIRKTCTAVDGDIAGIDENYIVVAPSYAEVVREEE
ncbi:MAG: cell division protein SepF [Candidatus Aenigmatarchaeota archaeon]